MMPPLQFTRFDNLRPICTFLYSSPSAPLFRPQQTPIVSSIAFNSDEDFFAVAGVRLSSLSLSLTPRRSCPLIDSLVD